MYTWPVSARTCALEVRVRRVCVCVCVCVFSAGGRKTSVGVLMKTNFAQIALTADRRKG